VTNFPTEKVYIIAKVKSFSKYLCLRVRKRQEVKAAVVKEGVILQSFEKD
jgi:hypothetical protein